MKATTKIRYDLFIAEYNATGNATQAAIKAGYAEKTARSKGTQLLSTVYISEKIKARAAEITTKTELTTQSIIDEYKKIAFVSHKSIYINWDQLQEFENIPDEVMAAVKSISNHTKANGDKYIKIEFYDKTVALAKLDEIMQRATANQTQTIKMVHYVHSGSEEKEMDSNGQELGNNLFSNLAR